MSKLNTSSKKFISIYDEKNPYENNKYFQTVILAYYMLTRNLNLFEGHKAIVEKNLWNELGIEAERYFAGLDVEIGERQKTEFNYMKLLNTGGSGNNIIGISQNEE